MRPHTLKLQFELRYKRVQEIATTMGTEKNKGENPVNFIYMYILCSHNVCKLLR